MKVLKFENNEALSEKASEVIIDKIKELDQPVIGLATGSTPERTYELLVEKYKADQVSFKNVTTFNLDEYVGLEPTHINSYHRFMNERLFDHVDIDKAKTFLPDGLADNAETEAERFEALIKEKGPIDLQVLGLGLNGHIGFNEPGTPFEARTHVAKLVESTREANARFFDHIDEVPTDAISMGIGTILDAKEIILLVHGEAKADILRQVIHGEITEDVPASILQKHPNVTVITDIDV
ncbi:MAG TPA: glucosamine-6-phosphate deaminase [Pseudogracilibacillus sp.]|nr:glucosamine-6-phosphate deaminase [Pseudogracilibacillus sp.]